MKIKIGTGYQTFSCSITPASGIIISAPEDEELDDDTVAYAICRLFCRRAGPALRLGELPAPPGHGQGAEGPAAQNHHPRLPGGAARGLD